MWLHLQKRQATTFPSLQVALCCNGLPWTHRLPGRVHLMMGLLGREGTPQVGISAQPGVRAIEEEAGNSHSERRPVPIPGAEPFPDGGFAEHKV